MKHTLVAMFLGAALSLGALADEADHKKDGVTGTNASQPATALSDGEIRRIDKDAKKITLRHGPLANLDMPAMTMVFQVKDPGMLDQAKVGDKVRFQAEKVGGAFIITHIEAAR